METNNYWTNKLIIWRARKFHKLVLEFCKEHNIAPSFDAFLKYSEDPNGYVSDTYKYLLLAPKYYLVNSKAFIDYYNGLDSDFQYDLMSKSEMRMYVSELISNYKLEKKLNEIMGKDGMRWRT